jgi:hypothetical protein
MLASCTSFAGPNHAECEKFSHSAMMGRSSTNGYDMSTMTIAAHKFRRANRFRYGSDMQKTKGLAWPSATRPNHVYPAAAQHVLARGNAFRTMRAPSKREFSAPGRFINRITKEDQQDAGVRAGETPD